MSYYGGDWYMGDYYGGDPGLFSAIGRFAKRAAGGFGLVKRAMPAVTAMVPGPMKPVANLIGRAAGMGKAMIRAHPTGTAVVGAVAAAGAMGAVAHRAAPTGAGMAFPGSAGAMLGAPAGVGAPRGYHMSKPHSGVAPHLVRNRRMHVTNPRALRRAIRRAAGFARLARKVMHFTSPRPPRGRAYFRPKRRRAATARA